MPKMKKTAKQIKEDKKEKPITREFRAWYLSIPQKDVYLTRKQIIKELAINDYKFANFLSGSSTPNIWERKIIIEIAGKNIFNPKES